MKTISKFALLMVFSILLLSSCKTSSIAMREPNVRVELNRDDFVLSEQFSAEVSRTAIFGIDFSRLFRKKVGSITNVSVIGKVLKGKTSNYALYKLMEKHPGYDVVFYPQYEITRFNPLGLGLIYQKSTVKVTTRLGQFRED